MLTPPARIGIKTLDFTTFECLPVSAGSVWRGLAGTPIVAGDERGDRLCIGRREVVAQVKAARGVEPHFILPKTPYARAGQLSRSHEALPSLN
jgi:hypothetical protein